METFPYSHASTRQILALGAESSGNFSFFAHGKIYFSADFGDLQEAANFKVFQKAVLAFLKKEALRPHIIITDLHPNMHTTLWGQKLCKKFQAEHIQVQHHLAHIFSQLGENMEISKQIKNSKLKIKNSFYGIAMDGTGFGLDEKIWGGEIFKITNLKFKISNERIGHLENQILLGGELAIQEPARMLIAILDKISNAKFQMPNKSQNLKNQKDFIFSFVKKYYAAQEFEVLYNQLQQNFNCLETSSTGRILDAVSFLLGFCENKRVYKHQPIDLLEKNSTTPYADLKPILTECILENSKLKIDSKFKIQNSKFILQTTPLFEYLIKNINKDKKRLAATAQLYIAEGLANIIKTRDTKYNIRNAILSGGIANNKIISEYFENKKTDTSSRMPVVQVPRGDAGLSLGQIIYFLFNH
jgi:hydrogenase maturation protein HypF